MLRKGICCLPSVVPGGCTIVTLSGFSPENPLRAFGDYNCYIDSFEYGIVELAHQVILHNIPDYFMDRYLK
jgi:D-sedoheptulose 7-phosphate isomerase